MLLSAGQFRAVQVYIPIHPEFICCKDRLARLTDTDEPTGSANTRKGWGTVITPPKQYTETEFGKLRKKGKPLRTATEQKFQFKRHYNPMRSETRTRRTS